MKKPITFETFKPIRGYEIGNLEQLNPSCFNGMVRVTKYKVTIETVDEPDEVIHGRIRKLWAECDNHHNRDHLLAIARQYGIELK